MEIKKTFNSRKLSCAYWIIMKKKHNSGRCDFYMKATQQNQNTCQHAIKFRTRNVFNPWELNVTVNPNREKSGPRL